jgi:hypothetical protein
VIKTLARTAVNTNILDGLAPIGGIVVCKNALAFDEYKRRDQANINLQFLETEIAKRLQETQIKSKKQI